MSGRKPKLNNGDILNSNRFGEVVVVGHELGGYIIKFLDTGAIVEGVRISRLRQGKIRDPSLPNNGNRSFAGVPSEVVREYYGMKARCRKTFPQYVGNKRDRWYDDCTLHPNFDTVYKFLSWREQQPFCNERDYLGKKYQIDKDILVTGNRCYGPDTCVYVPQVINGFFTFYNRGRDKLIGTSFNKLSGKYSVIIKAWPNKKVTINGFNTKEDAHDRYCIEKDKQARILAQHFAGRVDQRVINILNSFSTKKYISDYLDSQKAMHTKENGKEIAILQ